MKLNKRDNDFLNIARKAGITSEQAFEFIEQLKKHTYKNQSLFVRGFGTIEVVKHKPRTALQFTGEPRMIPSFKRVKVKMNLDYRNKLNNIKKHST